MSPEKTVVDKATDVTKTSLKLAESAIKKVWSIMDAASQKRSPSEYLSQQGINAMQGKPGD